ncbi:hypothetical protein E2C01_014868 [Portunus trituberculatus]|uniref:Uncharacterized protein n=1 Tax=Portunus trituberculatus TaxID=210409 RepID=A0A5B7DL32_PORTR|nr:hypothetical protein [Portunus trituberculatus]
MIASVHCVLQQPVLLFQQHAPSTPPEDATPRTPPRMPTTPPAHHSTHFSIVVSSPRLLLYG